jgi:uncharacterized repeat protein (TIGR02543 family)
MVTTLLGVVFSGCNNGMNGNTTQYTVTFDTDGGSVAPNTVKVDDGKSIGTLPTAPTKSLRKFDGWFTEKNGGGTEFKSDTLVTKDITVYAKWLSLFEGTWSQVSGPPGGLQIICTGDEYLLKQNSSNMKRCRFVYTDTTWTETILDNFGNSSFSIGGITVVNYTLVDNVLTITDMNQVFNKVAP